VESAPSDRRNEGGKGSVALTGATGFIGGAIAKRLADSGWSVKALVRDLAKANSLARLGVELVHGDLEDTAALRSLLLGVQAVVHCAGVVRGIDLEDFSRINVAGAERLASLAATMDPPPLFVALSSLAAREPQLSHYAASKREGEVALERFAGAMPLTILRPPAVYGPGDKEMLPLLLLMMRQGIAPVLGSAAARFSMLYVEDLAAAIEQSLVVGDSGRGVFALHDGRAGGYTWSAVVDLAARERGKPVRKLAIPRGLLHGLSVVSHHWARLTGTAPMLTPGKVRELTHADWVCDNAEVSRALDWAPQIEFAEGLRRTLAWEQAARQGTEY
jgi:nucleoside-diphosphate-sugar epimerase